MKDLLTRLKRIIQISWQNFIRLLKMLLNWRFLLCFGIAWIITNGWAYAFMIIGRVLSIGWMRTIGTSYVAILWLPITPEKILTIAIAVFLQKKVFPNDHKTKELINSLKTNKATDEEKEC